MTRSLLVSLVLMSVAAVAVGQPAGDPKAQAAADYAYGQTAYQAKDYTTAAAKFAEAYGLDPDPVYLFNAAQAYRFDNDCKRAADYYRLFLKTVPNAPNKDKVNGWLGEETRCVEDREAQAKAQAAAEALARSHDRPPPQPDHRAAFAVGGAGIVALAVGGFFTHVVFKIADEHDTELFETCKSGMPCSTQFVADRDAYYRGRADTAVTEEVVFYALGAAALAASTYLYIRANHHVHEEQPAVSVTLVNGGAMLVGGLRF